MARNIPISGLPLLIYKLRTGGLAWLSDRLKREWQMPTTRPGQMLYRSGRALLGRGRAVKNEGDTLCAFYDLAVAPLTFDFLWFLVGAELERKRRGLSAVDVVLVPGRDDGVRREDPEYETHIDVDARHQRIGNILIPAALLLPSVSGVNLASTRAEAERLVQAGAAVYPPRYETGAPSYPGPVEPLRAARAEGAAIGALRARAGDLSCIDRWLASHGAAGRVVTITLRDYSYMAGRNSNLAAWTEFARGLDPRYSVVFVPDTAQVFSGLPEALAGFTVCSEAAVNLGLRMALYERAYLNLGINNGPQGLCWMNDRTRYITFKMLSDSAPQTSVEYMRHLGFEIGVSLPFATPFQKWAWEDDALPVITREFTAMVARIDA